MRTRIKICGITRPDDALKAVDLGVDAVGLVFHAPSPRAVSLSVAVETTRVLPPFVSVVALFVDPSEGAVRQVLESVSVTALQFHGNEDPVFCREFGRPYIKAVAMRSADVIEVSSQRYSDASGLLLDTYREGVAGGTGATFDWTMIPSRPPKPIVLAGGLTAENVGAAIRRVRPYAVDVSSGVEAGKGIKDLRRMQAFVREVEQASRDL
jgi:phosphoribosylanthranilate isomerase